MKKILNTFANILAPIFFFVLILVTFLSFNNVTIKENDKNALYNQIEYNEKYQRSAFSLEGIKADGTKMTEEEIIEQKNLESKIVEIDNITPKIVTLSLNSNISIQLWILFVLCSTAILILLQFGIAKSILKIVTAVLAGTFINLIFIFNLTRYIPMQNFAKICSFQISILVISFITFVIFKITLNKISERESLKQHKQDEEKIKMRLRCEKEEKDKILKGPINSQSPIFVIASKENSTTTIVKEKKFEANVNLKKEDEIQISLSPKLMEKMEKIEEKEEYVEQTTEIESEVANQKSVNEELVSEPIEEDISVPKESIENDFKEKDEVKDIDNINEKIEVEDIDIETDKNTENKDVETNLETQELTIPLSENCFETDKQETEAVSIIEETVIQKDNLKEVDNVNTVTADYESIKKYLDNKENNNKYYTEEYKQENKDLPYADYDPEKENFCENKVFVEEKNIDEIIKSDFKIKVGLDTDADVEDDDEV